MCVALALWPFFCVCCCCCLHSVFLETDHPSVEMEMDFDASNVVECVVPSLWTVCKSNFMYVGCQNGAQIVYLTKWDYCLWMQKCKWSRSLSRKEWRVKTRQLFFFFESKGVQQSKLVTMYLCSAQKVKHILSKLKNLILKCVRTICLVCNICWREFCVRKPNVQKAHVPHIVCVFMINDFIETIRLHMKPSQEKVSVINLIFVHCTYTFHRRRRERKIDLTNWWNMCL